MLIAEGFIAFFDGDPMAGIASLERALQIVEANGDEQEIYHLRFNLARAKERTHPKQSRAVFESIVALPAGVITESLRGNACNSLGALLAEDDETAAGLTYSRLAVRIRRDLGDRRGMSVSLGNLGYTLEQMEDYTGAMAAFNESAELCLAMQKTDRAIEMGVARARVLRLIGQPDEATQELDRARAMMTPTTPWRNELALESASQMFTRQRWGALRDQLAEIRQQDLSPQQATAAKLLMARFALAEARFDDAHTHLDAARETIQGARPIYQRLGQLDIARMAVRLPLAQGDVALARQRLAEAWPQPEGAALRDQLAYHALALEVCEADGDLNGALQAMRTVRALEQQQARLGYDAHIAALEVEHRLTRSQLEASEAKQRAARLEREREQLTGLMQARQEALEFVAHDIQNPLQVVVSSLELLRIKWPHTTQDPLIDQALHNSFRIREMVRSLLRSIQIETLEGPLIPKAVNLADELLQMWRTYRLVAEQKGVIMRRPPPHGPRVWTHRAALLKILDNLISNAIKFTPPGGAVWLEVKTEPQQAVIRVCDQGPGISDTDRHRLFHRFARLSARPTAGEPSAGLGLHIAATLAARIGASLQCDNVEEGATFSLGLPIDPHHTTPDA